MEAIEQNPVMYELITGNNEVLTSRYVMKSELQLSFRNGMAY